MIATRQLVMEGVWVVGWQDADIADTLHLRVVAVATIFWLSMGYNFGCIYIYLLNTHSVQHTETDNEHIKHIKQ